MAWVYLNCGPYYADIVIFVCITRTILCGTVVINKHKIESPIKVGKLSKLSRETDKKKRSVFIIRTFTFSNVFRLVFSF